MVTLHLFLHERFSFQICRGKQDDQSEEQECNQGNRSGSDLRCKHFGQWLHQSYFTEGVITDVEYITLDLNKYDTTKSAAVGAGIGAAAGQIWGKDTKSTLIGAGIGALLSAGASAMMDRTSDGARLTINTNQGLVLVDQPFSCNYQRGAKVRLINQSDNTVQIQVLVNGTYRTAETNSPKECSL